MRLKFVNREAELRELDAAARRGGLLVVYGRRRVGKTQLLRLRDIIRILRDIIDRDSGLGRARPKPD